MNFCNDEIAAGRFLQMNILGDGVATKGRPTPCLKIIRDLHIVSRINPGKPASEKFCKG